MKYFFASDIHLGLKITGSDNREREQRFVEWLSMVERELESPDSPKGALYLLGDIFDYWFEYKQVVPKGFVRILGKLAQMCDKNIEIHFFVGNHDTWCYDYFEQEIGMQVHKGITIMELAGHSCLIGHGHELRTEQVNTRYRLMQAIFNSHLVYKIYSFLIHPDLNMAFGKAWSLSNRVSKQLAHTFKGEAEIPVRFAREELQHTHIDYFIFGHFHTAQHYPLTPTSTLILLGQWISGTDCQYAVLDETGCRLIRF